MKTITEEYLINHRTTKNAGNFVLVFLKMTGCSACDSYLPVFEEIEKNFPEIEFTVLTIDKVNELPLFASTMVPSIYLFLDGYRIAEAGGVKDKLNLLNTIKSWVIGE